ncbi:MAG: carbamoyltransferase C-terminal domain-containing protein [Planctomycetota bacterium]
MIILGLNQLPLAWGYYHDSTAALVRDGEIVAVAEEERFNRIRHTRHYPTQAIEFCLKQANIKMEEVDYIAVSINPYFIFKYPRIWARLHPVRFLHDMVNVVTMQFFKWNSPKPVVCIDHHLAHAASTYYCSGFEEANILTIDSSGERETLAVFTGRGNQIKRILEIPNTPAFSNQKKYSIGRVYSVTSKILGMGFGGEGKTMGLASYGQPTYDFSDILQIQSSKKWLINSDKVKRFEHLKREPHEDPTQEQKNLAASVQKALEDSILNLARDVVKKTGIRKFCLAGGVALNCTMNGKLANEDYCDAIFVQPLANDAGVALGAALEAYSRKSRKNPNHRMLNPYWGPEYSNEQIEKLLKYGRIPYEYHEDIERITAKEVVSGKVVGWFQGRMEGGPRALGNRSILANPTMLGMNDRVNLLVKNRERWRPFAPAICAEDVLKYFTKPKETPYMILTSYVLEEKKALLPAITHVDGSARVQTVSQEANPLFYRLLRAIEKENGIPMVLNTSFNDKGEPIVCTPKDALHCFYTTGLDSLAIGNYFIRKPTS